jgi:hypothetical protein
MAQTRSADTILCVALAVGLVAAAEDLAFPEELLLVFCVSHVHGIALGVGVGRERALAEEHELGDRFRPLGVRRVRLDRLLAPLLPLELARSQIRFDEKAECFGTIPMRAGVTCAEMATESALSAAGDHRIVLSGPVATTSIV